MDFMTTMYNFGIKDEIDPTLPGKTFNAYRNGNPDALLRLKVKDKFDAEEIVRYLKQKFKFKNTDRLRLFNAEGVEIYPEDFKYMKDDASIFISKGEGFDKSSTLSEYIMMRKLGEGSFGEVHLAAHKSSKQMVAIKFLRKPKQADAAGADRFFLEVEILKHLSHQNIIKILNCFTMKDMQIAIVMEYLEGGTLLNYVKDRKRLSEDQAKHFFKQMIEAVSYCHANKVIHCDLKLENILLVNKEDKNIKIIDFGIAGLKTHFKSKIGGGSLHHMCPETITGNKQYVHSGIDVWALGCILYEMVCGKWAFYGADAKKITEAICKGKFSFGALRNSLSTDLKSLITRMLERDPAKRITIAGILNHPWMNQPTQDSGDAPRKFFRLDSHIVAQINGNQKPKEQEVAKDAQQEKIEPDSPDEDEDDILSNL